MKKETNWDKLKDWYFRTFKCRDFIDYWNYKHKYDYIKAKRIGLGKSCKMKFYNEKTGKLLK